jgi:opacity protein-like surface antigen
MNSIKSPLRLAIMSIIGASSLLPHSIQATPATQTSCFKSGFYIGAQGGWSKMDVKVRNDFDSAPGGAPATRENLSTSASSVVMDALVGGRYFTPNGFMGGVDFTASFSNHKSETRFSAGAVFAPPLARQLRVDISRQNTFIPSLVIGWTPKSTFLIYGKVGLGIAQFKTTVFNSNAGGESFTQRKTKYGIVPSIGLEHSLSQSFSVNMSLSYEYYGTLKHAASQLLAIPTTDTCINTYKPSFVTGKVGILYKL